jgi:hypothetical protein
MELDSTHDLFKLKETLVQKTNLKSQLWNELMEAGTQLTKARNLVNDAQDLYMKKKTELRRADEDIKTLKTLIRSEGEFGA